MIIPIVKNVKRIADKNLNRHDFQAYLTLNSLFFPRLVVVY